MHNASTAPVPSGTPLSAAARDYCRRLLADVEHAAQPTAPVTTTTCDERWRQCGLDRLTGLPAQPVERCPLPLACYADGALAAFRELAATPLPYGGGGAELLTLRATLTALRARGSISPGGSCRLLRTRDGVIALNLAREGDWRLLDAWLLQSVPHNWNAIAERVTRCDSAVLVEQGRLLGLAVADAGSVDEQPAHWFERSQHGAPVRGGGRAPVVVDLSSLWAGPLCSRLLQWAGARVIKVESSTRVDGARNGSRAFFDFLNRDKEALQLDLACPAGREQLGALIDTADIVIEGSRPRALRQMGICAESLLPARPGLSWISITGHGRSEPQANWIAYGDDAGVAAGLSALLHRATGRWLVCGDAIADPLTGLHAAVAALYSWRAGGGHLVSLSLAQTVRHCIAFAGRGDAPCPA